MTMTTPSLADGDYEFRPEDRPTFPGGPFAPPHPPPRRLAYAAILLPAILPIGQTAVSVT